MHAGAYPGVRLYTKTSTSFSQQKFRVPPLGEPNERGTYGMDFKENTTLEIANRHSRNHKVDYIFFKICSSLYIRIYTQRLLTKSKRSVRKDVGMPRPISECACKFFGEKATFYVNIVR